MAPVVGARVLVTVPVLSTTFQKLVPFSSLRASATLAPERNSMPVLQPVAGAAAELPSKSMKMVLPAPAETERVSVMPLALPAVAVRAQDTVLASLEPTEPEAVPVTASVQPSADGVEPAVARRLERVSELRGAGVAA